MLRNGVKRQGVVYYLSLGLVLVSIVCAGVPAYAQKIEGLVDGDFEPSHLYNRRLALFGARLSDEVYSDNASMYSQTFHDNQFFDVSLFKVNSPITVFGNSIALTHSTRRISENRRIHVYAFRGTETDNGQEALFTDVYTDVSADPITPWADELPNVEVHGGIYMSLVEYIGSNNYVLPEDNDLVFITGHSLGGALALLFHTHLVKSVGLNPDNIQSYSFGAPPVGNDDYRHVFFNENIPLSQNTLKIFHHRIRNDKDPVPYLGYKLRPDIDFKQVGFFLNVPSLNIVKSYNHLGYETVFDENAKRYTQENMHELAGSAKSISSHSVKLYIARFNELRHPSQALRTALADGWTEEEYSRANYFLAQMTNFYLSTSDSASARIEKIERNRQYAHLALDVFSLLNDLGGAIRNQSKAIGDLDAIKRTGISVDSPIAKRYYRMWRNNKLRQDAIVFITSLLSLVAKADSSDPDNPYNLINQVNPFALFPGDSIETNMQRLFNAEQGGATDTVIATMASVLSELIQLAPETLSYIVANPRLLLVNTPDDVKRLLKTVQLTKKLPTSYIITKSLQIGVDVLAAKGVSNVTSDTNSRLLAASFLRYYYLSYRGNWAAFQHALGDSSSHLLTQRWTTQETLQAFLKHRSEFNLTFEKAYGSVGFWGAVFGEGYNEDEVLQQVEAFVTANTPLAFNYHVEPQRLYTDDSAMPVGQKVSLYPEVNDILAALYQGDLSTVGYLQEPFAPNCYLLNDDGTRPGTPLPKENGVYSYTTVQTGKTHYAFECDAVLRHQGNADRFYTYKPYVGIDIQWDESTASAADYTAAPLTLVPGSMALVQEDGRYYVDFQVQLPQYLFEHTSNAALHLDTQYAAYYLRFDVPGVDKGQTLVVPRSQSTPAQGVVSETLRLPVADPAALYRHTDTEVLSIRVSGEWGGQLPVYQYDFLEHDQVLSITNAMLSNHLLDGKVVVSAEGELRFDGPAGFSVNGSSVQLCAEGYPLLVDAQVVSISFGGVNTGVFSEVNGIKSGSCFRFDLSALSDWQTAYTINIDNHWQELYQFPLTHQTESVATRPSQPLNDTGITTCSDSSTNGLPCPVAGYEGQDGEYGRDVTDNDDSDGHAGFSFTKIDASGNPLPADAAEWRCVQDNVTGLMWEVKTDDGGLHDKDDTYNWYNPDPNTNGGSAGYQDDDGNICFGYDVNNSSTYCNTYAFVNRVNQQGYCGFNDWRMPTREELRAILSLDRINPAIDSDHFPNTASGWYWSSSPYAYSSVYAWIVGFYHGNDGASDKYDARSVRLVRAGQLLDISALKGE